MPYAYDTAGRLLTVTSDTDTATYTCHSNSDLVNTLTFKENGSTTQLVTTRTYDQLNRLSSISSQPTGATLPLSYAYTYNAANQRTQMTLADGSWWVYQYDQLGQVISGRRFWADGTPMAGQQFEYGFDDIGNRKNTGGRASATSTYHVNDLNQYLDRSIPNVADVFGIANPNAGVTVGVTGGTASAAARKGEYYHHALTVGNNVYPQIEVKSLYGATATQTGKVFNPPATEIYTHDADGNLTQGGRWTYVWDGENRLIEMRRNAATPAGARKKLAFEYDWQGRRIRKTVYQGDGSQTPTWTEQSDTVFLYDLSAGQAGGWKLIAELNANTSNAKVRTYVWGNDLSGSMPGAGLPRHSKTTAGGVGGLLKVGMREAELPPLWPVTATET